MLQTFQYQNSPITFSKDGEVMVNATQMAKPFGKLPADFLRLDQTQDFISALANRYGKSHITNPNTTFYEVIKGNFSDGRTQGTWMHQKLALKFAGWLSPEFELWVYDRIEELLTTGKTELAPKSKEALWLEALNSLTQEVSFQKEQLQLAEATIQKQAPAVMYVNTVLKSESCYTTTTIAKELGLAAKTLNLKLKALKIQYYHDGHWVLYQQHQNKGYTQTRTHTYYDSEKKQQTSLQSVWTEKGRAFIHTKLNPSQAVA